MLPLSINMGIEEFLPNDQTLINKIKKLILFVVVFLIFSFIFDSVIVGGIITMIFVIFYPYISKKLSQSSAAGNSFTKFLSSFFPSDNPQSNQSFYERSYGHGSVSIKNGSGRNARVYLTPSGTKEVVKEIFISAGSEGDLVGIGDGSYTLFFAFFDENRKVVARQRFDNTLNFTSSPSGRGIQYSTYKVTLHPVAGGNARTFSVDESDFPR
jgi:hypothetical protein